MRIRVQDKWLQGLSRIACSQRRNAWMAFLLAMLFLLPMQVPWNCMVLQKKEVGWIHQHYWGLLNSNWFRLPKLRWRSANRAENIHAEHAPEQLLQDEAGVHKVQERAGGPAVRRPRVQCVQLLVNQELPGQKQDAPTNRSLQQCQVLLHKQEEDWDQSTGGYGPEFGMRRLLHLLLYQLYCDKMEVHEEGPLLHLVVLLQLLLHWASQVCSGSEAIFLSELRQNPHCDACTMDNANNSLGQTRLVSDRGLLVVPMQLPGRGHDVPLTKTWISIFHIGDNLHWIGWAHALLTTCLLGIFGVRAIQGYSTNCKCWRRHILLYKTSGCMCLVPLFQFQRRDVRQILGFQPRLWLCNSRLLCCLLGLHALQSGLLILHDASAW